MNLSRDDVRDLKAGLATILLATETIDFAVEIIRRNANQLCRLLETKSPMEIVPPCPDA